MMSRTALAVKRIADLAAASALLVATAPVMVAVATLIPAKLGPGGVLFKQKRPGFHDEPFEVIKFRTMLEAFDENGQILPEGERLPPFGWFLRKYSIDELPQLLNVLRGEMSMIGPRPLLTEYLDGYSPRHRRRSEVKPGISGWAQVNGRHRATLSQRLDMDVWYVEHQSLWLDLKIAWFTVTRVLLSRDVERPDQPVSAFDDLGLHTRIKKRTTAG